MPAAGRWLVGILEACPPKPDSLWMAKRRRDWNDGGLGKCEISLVGMRSFKSKNFFPISEFIKFAKKKTIMINNELAIFQSESKEKLKLLLRYAKELGIKSKVLSAEESEDLYISFAIDEGMKTADASREDVMNLLHK